MHDEQTVKWPIFARFLYSPIGLLAILALAFQWPSNAWGYQVIWTLVVSYSFFCWTSCFHEAAHHTLCNSRPISIAVGRVLGILMFVPYTAYRESHIRHHAYLNKPTDWELWPYSDPRASLWFRRFFCWAEIPFGFLTSPFVYGRIYFAADSPLKGTTTHRTIGREYLVIASAWVAVILATSYFSVWPLLIQCWLIPHIIAGSYQTFRKFTEHLGMQSFDPLLGTRTVIGSNPLTKLCSFFNFDIFVHGPHHRHPRWRHEQLCNVMDDYQRSNQATVFPVYSSYLRAMADVLPAIVMNPGVGANAGASIPVMEGQQSQATDFAEVVTTDEPSYASPLELSRQ